MKGHFSERKVALTDFRRIYGVVFCTSLHGEATEYLLFVGVTDLFLDSYCDLAVKAVCRHRICRTQTTYDKKRREKPKVYFNANFGR